MEIEDENFIWAVRAFVYEHFVATTRPPTVAETAAHFYLSLDQAAALGQDAGGPPGQRINFTSPNLSDGKEENTFRQ